MNGSRYIDSAPDPTSVQRTRQSVCESEARLIVAAIKQALEDAERIGRGARVTGETSSPRETAAVNDIHRRNLCEWMSADQRLGIGSLAYCCEVMELRTGLRFEPDDFRSAIMDALAGNAAPTLLDWRGNNVTRSVASLRHFSPDRRSDRRRKSERERYRAKRAAMLAEREVAA